MLSGDFEFTHVEGDQAIFHMKCSEEHRRIMLRVWKAFSCFDCELGGLIHNIKVRPFSPTPPRFC